MDVGPATRIMAGNYLGQFDSIDMAFYEAWFAHVTASRTAALPLKALPLVFNSGLSSWQMAFYGRTRVGENIS